MAKITKKEQLTFGGDLSAFGNIAEFGSTKGGLSSFSLDPDDIQTGAYLGGWQRAIVNNKAPLLQDMNALAFLFTRQIGYLQQAGLAEWDSGTTYYIGSIVTNGSGAVYKSTIDNNTNHVVTTGSAWALMYAPASVTVTGPSTTLNCMLGSYFDVGVGAGGNKALTITNIADGQNINFLVTGASGDTVTILPPDGITTRTAGTNTMTSTYSLFSMLRSGSTAILTKTHGLS